LWFQEKENEKIDQGFDMRFSSAVTLSCRSVISTRYAGGLQSKLLCPWAHISEYLGATGFSDVDSPDSAATKVAEVAMMPITDISNTI